MYGRITSGASVWPTKMSATVDKLSAPLVPSVRAISRPSLRTTSGITPQVVQQRHQRARRTRSSAAPGTRTRSRSSSVSVTSAPNTNAAPCALNSSMRSTAALAQPNAARSGVLSTSTREAEQQHSPPADRAQADVRAPLARAQRVRDAKSNTSPERADQSLWHLNPPCPAGSSRRPRPAGRARVGRPASGGWRRSGAGRRSRRGRSTGR